MKPSNTSVANPMRQEAEKLAPYSPSVISIDSTKEEIVLQNQKLELRIAELELQNEMQATNNAEKESIALQYLSFFRHAPTAYLIVTEAGEILSANIKGAALLGEELSQLKNSNLSAFLSPDQDSRLRNFLQTIFETKRTETTELSFKANATSIITLTAVFIGDMKHCLLQMIDDTNFRREFDLFQQERGFIQDILNTQPAGIYRLRVFPIDKWEKDSWKDSKHPPYIMEFLNDRFCNILGVSHDTFKKKPGIISELIHPQDKEEFVRLNEAANQKNTHFKWDGRIIVSEKIKWIHLESIPRVIESGEILWTGLLYDITDAKQLEADLKLSESKFKNVFDYSIVGKSLTTLNGQLHVNSAFAEILGYSKEELENSLWKDITLVDDVQANKNNLDQIISGKKNQNDGKKDLSTKMGAWFGRI